VAADLQRPAAVQQLQTLGAAVDVPVFTGTSSPPEVAEQAVKSGEKQGMTVVIIDTAGRRQIDDALMDELVSIRDRTKPVETLLVADAMTGQEAVRIAEGFHKKIGLTGLVLTKIEGDARGGAAISMRSVTGVPIKFLGTGEKTDALEVFDPGRVASRILGMGDILGLIEKAEANLDRENSLKAAEKLVSGAFTLEDFLSQIKEVRKMGPIGQLLGMIPGLGASKMQIDEQDAEKQMKRTEAIIQSMTLRERRNPDVLNGSRKRRIATGSGTTVYEVNQLIKQFKDMQKMMKQLGNRRGLPGLPRAR